MFDPDNGDYVPDVPDDIVHGGRVGLGSVARARAVRMIARLYVPAVKTDPDQSAAGCDGPKLSIVQVAWVVGNRACASVAGDEWATGNARQDRDIGRLYRVRRGRYR